jgi:hypothetical protein
MRCACNEVQVRYFATLSTNQMREVFDDEKPATLMPFTMLLSLVPISLIVESNCLEYFDNGI